ncbi:MAG: hypothetical protein JW716_01355 [Candidatus Aenigmarchaeota archaeon]|nr:hypothetical protein [Candidatus Aenigmarchaeota archaeon]
MKLNNTLFVAVTIILGMLLLSYNAMADCGTYSPPDIGNWVINDSDIIACSDMGMTINGNLTVNGILQMTNVTLKMNSSNGSFVHINNTGTFEIISSNVEKAGQDNYLFWNINPDVLEITDSNISDCGINATEEMNRGIYIETNDLQIEGSLFEDNFVGLIIKGSNVSLDENIFADNGIHLIITGNDNNLTSNEMSGANSQSFFTGNNFFVSKNILLDSLIDIAGSGIRFINNSINSGDGLYVNGDGSTIENNTITGCEYGLKIGDITNSDNNVIRNNVLRYNKYGFYVDKKTTNSRFSGNYIKGNLTNGFSVAGIYLLGIENVLDNNVIDNNVYGIFASGSSRCNVTGSVLKDNNFGLFSDTTASLLIKDSVIENNTKTDLDILSTSLTLINANYTTMFRNWTVIVQAFDSNGTRVNFTVQLESNTASLSYLDDSVSGENITFNVPEFFENKSLNDSVKEYNPYIIRVSNTYIEGFQESSFNFTTDWVYTVNFNGTYNDTYNPPVNFILSVINPRNQTYIRDDFVNGSLPAEVQSTTNLTGCVYVLNDASAESMTNTGLKSYTAYIDADDFLAGMNKIYFSCSGPGGLHNITNAVYFTVYADRECLIHDDCLESQFCKDYECTDIECGCGIARDHECAPYECCSDDSCQLTEQCINHQCKAVNCDCPEKISNHRCIIPAGYCCKSTMCTGTNEICDMNLNRCIERTIKLILSTKDAVVGEELEITVRDMQGVAVGDADITANFASGNKITAKTDGEGKAKLTLPEAGEVNIVVRKSGYAAASSDIVVREGFNLLIVLLIVIIGIAAAGAFLYIRSRGGLKKQKPVSMKKIIQGNNVILSIKNDTKDSMRNVIINDQVPHGAFITSNMRPQITQFDANTDNLSWEFIALEPGQEVSVTYQTYRAMEGFSVRIGDQEYLSE